jgi:glycosyltransferase involved in cell wall biosynthesis
MKILIATAHRGVVGGVETYLRALLAALRGRGHELALLYDHPAPPGAAAIDDLCPDLPAWPTSGKGNPVESAAAWGPEVCYLQGLTDPGLESALAGRFPVAFFAHNYAGTCVSGTKRLAFPTARPCSRTLGPGCLARFLPCRCGGLNPITAVRLYRDQRRRLRLIARFQAVLVASRHMAAEYRRHGLAPERLHVVPLFPPGQVSDPTPPAERPPTGRVLLLGRLTDLKGGRLLIEAVAAAGAALGRRLTLDIAGDGPERPALEGLARRLGVRAAFAGWVDERQREALLRQADLLAVASVWPEPFGLVGIEAGCVGLPAVAFAVGGIPDWLSPGESGELAPADPPTARGLAAALVRALKEPDHWSALRRGAWRMAQQFTAERHVGLLGEILNAACGLACGGRA